jgi:hypothetical protein
LSGACIATRTAIVIVPRAAAADLREGDRIAVVTSDADPDVCYYSPVLAKHLATSEITARVADETPEGSPSSHARYFVVLGFLFIGFALAAFVQLDNLEKSGRGFVTYPLIALYGLLGKTGTIGILIVIGVVILLFATSRGGDDR